MNRSQKRILKLTTGIIGLSFALITASVGTVAWFVAKTRVSADNMEIECTEDKSSLVYEILKYSDDKKAGVSSKSTADFYLPEYDQYITERNDYANVVLRTQIGLAGMDSSNEEIEIDITRLASSFKTDGKINPFTSNVIQFKSVVRDYNYLVDGNEQTQVLQPGIKETESGYASIADAKYRTSSTYFDNRNTPTTFVAIRGSSVVKDDTQQTIKIIPSVPENLVITRVTVYIECSYNPTLVTAYLDSRGGDDAVHNLNGDISNITFKTVARSGGSSATGKYMRVESEQNAIDGQYLIGQNYVVDGNQTGKMLNGALATSSKAAGEAGGINVVNNFVTTRVNAPSGDVMSINSTEDIDNASLKYNETDGTFKTSTGYYIGNNTTSNGIASRPESTNLGNDVTFNNSHTAITSNVGGTTFGMDSNKLSWYKVAHNVDQMDSFRYSENSETIMTLKSISMTREPSSAQKQFYVDNAFNVNGLEVTAVYTCGGVDQEVVVTSQCKFRIAGASKNIGYVFTQEDINASKAVSIDFTDSGKTLSLNSAYYISVSDDPLLRIEVKTPVNKTTYMVNENLDLTGLSLNAVYQNRGSVPLESGYTFKYNSAPITDGTVLTNVTAGTKLYACYTGVSDLEIATIIVKAYFVKFVQDDGSTPISTTVQVFKDSTASVKLSFNANLTITKSNNNINIDKTTATYTGLNYENVVTTLTITGVTAGDSSIEAKCTSNQATTHSINITVSEMAVEHFSISTTTLLTGKSGYNRYSLTNQTCSDDEKRDFVITYGGNQKSIGTNNTNRANCKINNADDTKYLGDTGITSDNIASAFAVRTELSGISKLQISKSGGSGDTSTNVYVLYSSNDTTYEKIALTSGTQGCTFNGDLTFNFSARKGYFVVVFEATNDNGNWRLDDVVFDFNKVTLDHISIEGTPNKNSYNYGEAFNPAGSSFLIRRYFDDSSNDTVVVADSGATYSPTILTNSTKVTFTYTHEDISKSADYNVAVVKSTITLNKNSTGLYKGAQESLTPTVNGGSDASTNTVGSISWSSNNTSTASVDSSGKITANASGTCVITAELPNGNKATCNVTVYALNGISVTTNPTKMSYEKGQTLSFSGMVVKASYTNGGAQKTVSSYTTSPSAGYTFTDADVTAGTKNITISYTEGDIIKTTTLTVSVTSSVIHVTGVSLNKSSTTINVGSTETLIATVAPDNAANKNVTWSSSSTSIATVDESGKVTGVSAGEATITVTTVDGDYTAECTVTVQSNTTTVTQTGFSSTSGNLNNDSNISYASYKGGGTTNPVISSNSIRLYQGSAGGLFVLSAKNGKKIKSFSITSNAGSNSTTIGYALVQYTTSTASSNFVSSSLSSGGTLSIDNINTDYVTIACLGSTKNNRLDIYKVVVSYA